MPFGAAILCLVVAIADGDTLTARCGQPGAYEQVKVRLAEIDAPEKAQPFGQRSKEHLSALCFNVTATIKSQTTDRYGRTVARVECRGKDANAEMTKAGMAWAFTKYQTDPAFPGYEQAARAAKLGLWRDANPQSPWDFRGAKRLAQAAPQAPVQTSIAAICHTGPRGGRYTLTASGAKHYGC